MRRLSSIHPVFYHTRIAQKQLFRSIKNLFMTYHFATEQAVHSLDFSCKRHQSLLRRRLGNSDPQLQVNKIVNLRLACPTIDGLLIRPQSTFSFWQRLGKPTAAKGYVEGMQLSRGEVKTGIGGGLCQLANLLYWLALHTPLIVVERHHHSFDPFPDDHRTLPFGSGAGVFYNYIDLRFYNPTDQTFQIRVWITDKHLKGAIYTDKEWPYSYHIFERNHQFIPRDNKVYRANEIWRSVIDRQTGMQLHEEHLINNFAEVKYPVDLHSLQLAAQPERLILC